MTPTHSFGFRVLLVYLLDLLPVVLAKVDLSFPSIFNLKSCRCDTLANTLGRE